MTLDHFWFYLSNPAEWLRWKRKQFKKWNLARKAKKAARLFMAEILQMEANLKAAADPFCPKCYGQGQRGFNLTYKKWETCRCTYNPRTAEKCEEKPWLRS